jgi:hypothetical protein
MGDLCGPFGFFYIMSNGILRLNKAIQVPVRQHRPLILPAIFSTWHSISRVITEYNGSGFTTYHSREEPLLPTGNPDGPFLTHLYRKRHFGRP